MLGGGGGGGGEVAVYSSSLKLDFFLTNRKQIIICNHKTLFTVAITLMGGS